MTKNDGQAVCGSRTNILRAKIGAPVVAFFLGALVFAFGAYPATASDHLDTPTVTTDPAADIGDLFAWTSSDGRRLNLVMTIVAHRFSDRLQYVFHVDSGAAFGRTTATTTILCRFDAENIAECWAGEADYLRGDASQPAGLGGQKGRFRVFAGLRDDPFFNNVKGTRTALNVAAAALRSGTKTDAAGCANFDETTSQAIFDRWRHTENGPPANFLAGWKSAALVVSVDLDAVDAGGKQLAVWAGTYKPSQSKGLSDDSRSRPVPGTPVERIGRELTANMLIGPLDTDDASDRRKETYNRAAPAGWPQFADDIERSLGIFDAYDRTCGNQWLANRKAKPARYRALARLLAADRLWINSRSTVCAGYLAVELANFNKTSVLRNDCGGRTPNYNANAVFRSLLVRGAVDVVDDGLERDDGAHSTTSFPFLAPPSGSQTEQQYSLADPAGPNDITGRPRPTTSGAIAFANLDHLIAQRPDEAGVDELLLARARFLGDYEALDRAVTNAEKRFESGDDLLRRARARSAVHRFAEALDDLAAAEAAGARRAEIDALRASILVATGRAAGLVPELEREVARRPTLRMRTALANAYAAVGRFADADRMYAAAFAELDTTSPFPHAWLYFARGLMWTEQAGDPACGAAMYRRALDFLPEFAAANIHLAELEAAGGELTAAIARLERLAASANEPEALALLGELLVQTGDPTRGRLEIARARQRYDSLLTRHPLAFADHAAEFYLGPGSDAERAWELASRNLANRQTRASFALAVRAAAASGRDDERRVLLSKARARFGGFEVAGALGQTF